MVANPEHPCAKPPLRSGSVDSDCRLLTSTLYPAADFIASPMRLTPDVPLSLPISNDSLNSMREKLLVHDKIFMKYIGNSKDTVAMKSSLQDLFIAYQPLTPLSPGTRKSHTSSLLVRAAGPQLSRLVQASHAHVSRPYRMRLLR